jgi:hypothetical protein
MDDENGVSIDLGCDRREVLQCFVYTITQGAKPDSDLPGIHGYIRNKASFFRLPSDVSRVNGTVSPTPDDEVRQRT